MTAHRVCFVAVMLGLPSTARASFHLWEIQEVFTNADGSIQYVELFTSSNGQTQVDTQSITADSDGSVVTFTFEGNLGGGTANHHLLIATPGFANLPGAVAPDYVLPCGPFFDPDATTITITFAGADAVTFDGTDLPRDGIEALHDQNLGGVANLQPAAASPTSFSGAAGALALEACQVDGSCDACDDALFCNGAESCAAGACAGASPCPRACDEGRDACVDCLVDADCADGTFCNGVEQCVADACVAGAAPCPELCDEAGDACVQCLDDGDCDDAELCTDDGCDGGACSFVPNAVACDDGLFCTTGDACAGGECLGAGDACDGANCNEGTDECGACGADEDCDDANPCTADACLEDACSVTPLDDGAACPDDGAFCTGAESCRSGGCESAGDPCDASTTCFEDRDACVPRCGDGSIADDEECDDGNGEGGDGCSAACDVEDGFECEREPSVCEPVAGDPDAGPDAGAARADAGPDAGPDAGSAAPAGGDGCDCSMAAAPDHGRGALLLAMLALVARRRARQRRGQPSGHPRGARKPEQPLIASGSRKGGQLWLAGPGGPRHHEVPGGGEAGRDPVGKTRCLRAAAAGTGLAARVMDDRRQARDPARRPVLGLQRRRDDGTGADGAH